MATTAMTVRCREYFMRGVLAPLTDTLMMALYNGSSHGPNTTAYSATNEASGSGYTAKGKLVTNPAITTDTTNFAAILDFDNVQWTSSTITATDALLFADNVTSPAADPAMSVHDFGGARASANGNFTLTMPGAAYNTAVLRIV